MCNDVIYDINNRNWGWCGIVVELFYVIEVKLASIQIRLL